MKNTNKKRRIASALAILSTVSTMAMPISTLAASADEVIEEVPAIVQEATVAEDEDCGIESLDSVEETTEEKTEENTEEKAEENTEENTEEKAEENTEEYTEEYTEMKAAGRTTKKEAAKTTEKEAAKTTEKKAAKTTEKEAAKTTEKEAAKTTEKKAAKTTKKEAAKTTEKKAEEKVEEKTDEKAEEKVEISAEELIEKKKIRNYFDDEFEDFDSDVCAGQLDYTHEATSSVRKVGKDLVLTKSKHVDNSQDRDRFAIMNSNAAIYPGALVTADKALAKGDPRVIDLPRGTWTVRVEEGPLALGANPSRRVTDNTSAKDMVKNLEDCCLSPDTTAPAKCECTIEKIYSDDHFKAKAHFEQNVYGKFATTLKGGIGTTKQAVFIDCTQVYYKVSADIPAKENLFANNVTLEEVQKKINKDKPAAIVSSIDYGRRIVACIETDDNTFDLEATINASGFKDAVKGDGSLNIDSKLSHCNVHYYIYGGESTQSSDIITCLGAEALPKMVKIIADGASYKRNVALPLSYTTNFLHDNRLAKVNFKEDYYVNTTETITPTAVNISSGDMYAGPFGGFFGKHGNVDTHTIKLTGKKIEALDENGGYVYGPEETIYEREFTKKDMSEKTFEEIPAEYDLSTVRVYFDYIGNKKTGFQDNENGIKLTDLVGNPTDIKKVNIDIESVGRGTSYVVTGTVNVTDKNGKTHERLIRDSYSDGTKFEGNDPRKIQFKWF